MLQRIKFTDLNFCKTGLNLATGSNDAIGQDFIFDWGIVREFSMGHGYNLDWFITPPIAWRLFEKRLLCSITFWYTPLNNHFVITVCSKRNVDFMNPLHGLPGYSEYGQSFLRQNARPIIYWDGHFVFRIHPIFPNTSSEYLVEDLGNLFALFVEESDQEQYNEILQNPVEYFDYLAVPVKEEQSYNWNGKLIKVKHILCEMPNL